MVPPDPNLPLTVISPVPGNVTVPDVTLGVEISIVKIFFLTFHFTPNQPSPVSRPPSADSSPLKMGAIVHVCP